MGRVDTGAGTAPVGGPVHCRIPRPPPDRLSAPKAWLCSHRRVFCTLPTGPPRASAGHPPAGRAASSCRDESVSFCVGMFTRGASCEDGSAACFSPPGFHAGSGGSWEPRLLRPGCPLPKVHPCLWPGPGRAPGCTVGACSRFRRRTDAILRLA